MTKLVVIATFSPVLVPVIDIQDFTVMLLVYGVLTRKRKTENTRASSKLCLRGYLRGIFAWQPWDKSSVTQRDHCFGTIASWGI